MVAALVVSRPGRHGGAHADRLAQTKFAVEHRDRWMDMWTSAFFFGQFTSPWLERLDVATGSIHGAFLVAGVAAIVVATGAVLVAMRNGTNRSAPAEGA